MTTNNIDKKLEEIVKSVLTPSLISTFKLTSVYDKNRFDVQDENAKMICDAYTGEYTLMTVKDYCLKVLGKDPASMSNAEWAEFDAHNGDIIVLDSDNNVLWNIDLKVSDKFFGSIAAASLTRFSGTYLCVCLNKGTYKLVSHEALEELAKEPGILTPPLGNPGKHMNWNGRDISTTWFIKGVHIERYF